MSIFRSRGTLFLSCAKVERDLATRGALANSRFYLLGKVLVLAQEILGVFATLTEAYISVREESTTLGYYIERGGKVNDIADLGNTFIVNNIELSGTEGWGNLVLDYADSVCGYR